MQEQMLLLAPIKYLSLASRAQTAAKSLSRLIFPSQELLFIYQS